MPALAAIGRRVGSKRRPRTTRPTRAATGRPGSQRATRARSGPGSTFWMAGSPTTSACAAPWNRSPPTTAPGAWSMPSISGRIQEARGHHRQREVRPGSRLGPEQPGAGRPRGPQHGGRRLDRQLLLRDDRPFAPAVQGVRAGGGRVCGLPDAPEGPVRGRGHAVPGTAPSRLLPHQRRVRRPGGCRRAALLQEPADLVQAAGRGGRPTARGRAAACCANPRASGSWPAACNSCVPGAPAAQIPSGTIQGTRSA